jgi:hypothetical protein
MWAQIDDYIRVKSGGRLSRSAFIEDYVRQTLEEKGKAKIEDSGTTLSVNSVRASIHRLKDFIATNAQNKTAGNLEAVRLELVEAADFINQVIKKSRRPTKSDKRQMALRDAIAAHEARIGRNGEVINGPPMLAQDTQPKMEKQPAPDLVPVDLEYEMVLREVYADYKEEQPPKADFEIIDERRTERNPYDESGREEIFK